MALISDRTELERNGFTTFGDNDNRGNLGYLVLAGSLITVLCERTIDSGSYRVRTANDANDNSYKGRTPDDELRFHGKILPNFLKELREPTHEPPSASTTP